MASTPSASALAAVLRCRGNILTRNPPTKRPATSAYNFGLTGERTRSNRASTWEILLRGQRVAVGKRLSVTYVSSRLNDKVLRKKDPLLQSSMFAPEDARLAASGAKNALLVRQLARKLISNLFGKDKSSQSNCSAHDATHPLICKQDVESTKNDALQANGHILSSSDPSVSSSSGQKITEDRPD
ncbi:hypothetical protein LDENG_00081010 [Lucifuga dentata]|nr:hypothetical protein LDENG_00081010 [Lucifuga dentata]